jgi:ABC-2 type transport system ATP-binding protein
MTQQPIETSAVTAPSQSQLVIHADAISYKYANNNYYSVDNISLKLNKGQCIGIIGPNGAGKSTLISLLCGLLTSQQGSVNYYVESDNLSLQQSIEKYVALIPQEYAFYPELSVQQNLEYFIALNKTPAAEQKKQLKLCLSQCQLQQVAKQKADSLSGGFKRRLNIAIALSKSPQIIFLDEPTVGIDPVSRQEIINLLQGLKSQGKTLIYTSHMLNEVEHLCDEVILLEQGKAIAISQTSTDNMFLNFELKQRQTNVELLQKLALNDGGLSEINATTFQINISDLEHLQQVFSILTNNLSQIKSLQFSQNSIDQLYFNSFKATTC